MRPPSRLVYDISGRGFTRFRGSIALDNPRSEIGSTLNPAVRFFVFDGRAQHGSPAAAGAAAAAAGRADARDRRAKPSTACSCTRSAARPRLAERRLAVSAISDPARAGRPSADGLADLLWALLMKPEFQLIY